MAEREEAALTPDRSRDQLQRWHQATASLMFEG